jgi:ribosomal protein L11 methyltransferase
VTSERRGDEPPPEPPRYPFVHVEVTPDEADALSSVLFDLGATGVEERDGSTLLKAPEGKVLLVASFDARADADEAIALLHERDPSLVARIEEIVGDEWRDAYKEFFKPFLLTPGITIKPPWCEVEDPRGKILELEPGRAFGTGLHATTSLVARILEDAKADLAGARVLDAGTGSGILALVAIVCGASSAVAFDVDADVIPVVLENAERNGLASQIETFAGTIDDVVGTFPWVVANIEARVLDPLADAVAARVALGGHLVLSGILATEEDRMVRRYSSLARPLDVVEVRLEGTREDGWVAIHLRARA